MTTTDIFTVVGIPNKWNAILGEFTIGTPVGEIRINIDKCGNQILDAMIDAMKNRWRIEIKVVKE